MTAPVEPQPTAPPRCTPGRCAHPGPLCDPCADTLALHLAQLPELWVRLTLAVARSTAGGGPHVAGTREPPCPIRPAVVDHMTHTAATLARWAAGIAEQRSLTAPAWPTFGFHATHAPWSAGRPWAGQYAADIHAIWHPAMTLTRSWPDPAPRPQHAPGVACPRCQRQALHRTAGLPEFRCDPRAGGCGARLTLKTAATAAAAGRALEAS